MQTEGSANSPVLNTVQLLWLKELGVEQLWGQPLRAQASPQLNPQHGAPQQAAFSDAKPAPDSHSSLATVQEHNSVTSGTNSTPASAERPINALGSEPRSQPSTQVPTAVPLAKHKQEANKHFEAIRQGMARQQSHNRRMQRNQHHRQAEQGTDEVVVKRIALEPDLTWEQLQAHAQKCEACSLAKERTQVVWGELGTQAKLMIIDEMPGVEHDLSGHLFDSRSGQLLDNMLAAIGLERQSVLLTSLLKCRSASDAPNEVCFEQCQAYLSAQIQLVQPQCILVLGRAAFSFLAQEPSAFESLRAQAWSYTTSDGLTIPVVVSYHPSYLMVHQEDKALAWQDLKKVAQLLS